MQQLNPSEISEIIKGRIDKLDVTSQARNEGTVVSVSDGIVRIHGLADVMYGEMIEFPGGVYGMALNLEQDLQTGSSSEPVSVSLSTCGTVARSQAWLLHGCWDPTPGPMFAGQCSYHSQPTPSLSILVLMQVGAVQGVFPL